jgi:hypothetical protein
VTFTVPRDLLDLAKGGDMATLRLSVWIATCRLAKIGQSPSRTMTRILGQISASGTESTARMFARPGCFHSL